MVKIAFQNASFVIQDLQSLVRVVGVRRFRKAGEHRQNREKWAVAATLLGIQKIQNRKLLMAMNKEDPPDAFVAVPNTKGVVHGVAHVEVVRLEKHGKNNYFDPKKSNEENVINFLKEKKFTNKAYEKGTLLFLHLDANIGEIQFGELFKKTKPENLAEVWSLAYKGSGEYVVACLFPERSATTLSLNKI